MDKFKRFAVKQPLLFGLLLIVVYALLTTIAYPLHYLFPDTEAGLLYGEGAVKMVVCAIILLLLGRFGWLKASGLLQPGKRNDWLVFTGILIYLLFAELYAFTGSFQPVLPTTPLAAAVTIVTFAGALVEELMFRALVLVAMVLAWGNTKGGLVKSVVLSGLFFGFMHLFNIMIRPLGVVLFQAIVVSLPGILYGAIVLKSRSLWPAIVIHWLTNSAVNLKITQIENYQETNTVWTLFALALIPVTIYSAYVLWKLPATYTYDLSKDVRELEPAILET